MTEENMETECPECGSYVWNGCFAHCPTRQAVKEPTELEKAEAHIRELEDRLNTEIAEHTREVLRNGVLEAQLAEAKKNAEMFHRLHLSDRHEIEIYQREREK